MAGREGRALMDKDDIKLLALAEKNADPNSWSLIIKFSGHCLIGCKGRKLLTTDNLVKAAEWVDYHREGPEHIAKLLENRMGSGQLAAEFDQSVFKSTNGEETQP